MLSINTTCFTNAWDIETTLNMQFWALNAVNGSTTITCNFGFQMEFHIASHIKICITSMSTGIDFKIAIK